MFLVSPKGHQVYTLTNLKKEPYIHSPITVIYTLLQMSSQVCKRLGPRAACGVPGISGEC